jgi:hypothetical protein
MPILIAITIRMNAVIGTMIVDDDDDAADIGSRALAHERHHG